MLVGTGTGTGTSYRYLSSALYEWEPTGSHVARYFILDGDGDRKKEVGRDSILYAMVNGCTFLLMKEHLLLVNQSMLL